MPRPLRVDFPGALHHVMNQGNGKRPIFESRADVRFFLSLVGREVRRGRIQVLSYSIMITHYHLLLRSVDGGLADSMKWIQDLYARYFNRTRGKGGHAYGSRYRAKLIDSGAYFLAVVWYIDRNPVEARVVASPELYPYGSAWHYARQRGPIWLARGDVEALAMELGRHATFDCTAYVATLSGQARPGLKEIMDQVSASSAPAPLQDLGDLVGSAPEHVRRWLERNAKNADGGPSGVVVASSCTIRRLVTHHRGIAPNATVGIGRRKRCKWTTMEAGLLHQACGLSLKSISSLQGSSLSAVHARVIAHRRSILKDDEFALMSAKIVHDAIASDFDGCTP